jgi:hypothetical protein
MEMEYLIRRASLASTDELRLDHPIWSQGDELEIAHFHATSSDHRPRTRVRALHDGVSLFVRFEVDDQYVISKRRQYQELVFQDSCVEFFFQPRAELGHFNIEINCGGTLLFYYVEDPTRTPTGLAKYTRISSEIASQIQIIHSTPSVVLPERSEPTRWLIALWLPLSALEPYVGPLGDISRATWRGNFYKCADHSSHPHWGSWSPLGEILNFHDRAHFGILRFDS